MNLILVSVCFHIVFSYVSKADIVTKPLVECDAKRLWYEQGTSCCCAVCLAVSSIAVAHHGCLTLRNKRAHPPSRGRVDCGRCRCSDRTRTPTHRTLRLWRHRRFWWRTRAARWTGRCSTWRESHLISRLCPLHSGQEVGRRLDARRASAHVRIARGRHLRLDRSRSGFGLLCLLNRVRWLLRRSAV